MTFDQFRELLGRPRFWQLFLLIYCAALVPLIAAVFPKK